MAQVAGIPQTLPPLVPYPQKAIFDHLPRKDWEDFLDVWLLSIEFRLRLKVEHFAALKFSQNASGVPFLLSYLRQYEERAEPLQSGTKDAKLHHQCYFLTKRLLLTTRTPFDCSASMLFDLLSSGSLAFHAIADWRNTLKQVWKRNELQIRSGIDATKIEVIKGSHSASEILIGKLSHLSALVKSLPEAAVAAVAGADFLEGLASSYLSQSPAVRKAMTESVYHCCKSLLTGPNKHISLLLDVLFDVKAETDRVQKTSLNTPTLLSNLLCSTPFLRHLKAEPSITTGNRGQGITETLTTYRQNMLHLHPPTPRSKSKGKARVRQSEDIHIHQASKVSEVHELFPDLPGGYVLKLLDHYSDDAEAVVAALLEPESLPLELQDQTDGVDMDLQATDGIHDLAPRSTPPFLPQRKNQFDDDEFDKLQISSSRLQRGRKELAETSPTAEEHSRSKAAIIAALAAFDSDDDERDDTYDVADVGGAVDNTLDSDERRQQVSADKNEETLYRAWAANPELFGRDSKTRMSKPRRQLAEDTGMSNEQLEGWAIMATKEPGTVSRLQQKYSSDRTFRGNQRVIESTKWQASASPSESADEGSGAQSDGRRVGQAGIRGPRVWGRGRGRGGSTAGPAGEDATQIARKRKEQGRGRGGSAHNRREGRAKKIGRGMAGPA